MFNNLTFALFPKINLICREQLKGGWEKLNAYSLSDFTDDLFFLSGGLHWLKVRSH